MNFDANLCPSVSGTPLVLVMGEHQLSKPDLSLNRLNFNTRHDVSSNNFSLLGCGDLDRSSVSLIKPAADTTVCRNPAVRRQRLFKTFQTVNHAKVLWDPKLKLRGLFGGHFNIRSITAKSNQLTHLVSDSNLDFLCLTETWLKQTTPASVFTVPEYQCFSRDRPDGRGDGVLSYVGDNIKCEHVVYNAGNTLEYVGLKIM